MADTDGSVYPGNGGGRRALAALLAAAALVRLYVLVSTAVIAIDGVEYISVARLYSSLRLSEALGHYWPPAYPVLVALFHVTGISWELAGQLVSFTAGILTVFPLYFLVRGVYSHPPGDADIPGDADRGRTLALLAVLFYAFLPDMVRHSVQVRSEGVYILFAMSAIYFGWRGISTGRIRPFLLLGLFSSLAYFTRPEGLGLLFVCMAWMIAGLPKRFRLPWRKRLVRAALALLPAVIIAGGYITYISTAGTPEGQTPGLRLTLKASPAAMLKGELIDESFRPREGSEHDALGAAARVTGWLRACGEFLGRLLLRNLHLLLFPLLVLALLRRKETPRDVPFEFFVISLILFFVAVFSTMRVSYRLMAQLVTPLLFLPALGYFEFAGMAKRRFGLSGKSLRRFHVCVLVVILVVMSAEMVPPVRMKRQGIRLCGEWIRRNHAAGKPKIATDLARVVFYAQGEQVVPPAYFLDRKRKVVDRPALEKMAALGETDYFALDESTVSRKDMDYLRSLSRLGFVATFKPASGRGLPVALFRFFGSAGPPGEKKPGQREN